MSINCDFEERIAQTEFFLSQCAIIPVIGTVAGVVKVIFGILQTLAALIVMALSICFGHKQQFDRAISHLANGLANIGAGILEAIPLIGTGIGIWRVMRVISISRSNEDAITTEQEHMILVGYQILEENKEFSSSEGWVFSRDEPRVATAKATNNTTGYHHVRPYLVV